MDLPTIANFAEAFAVIVAVVFGMVQLRQPKTTAPMTANASAKLAIVGRSMALEWINPGAAASD